MTRTILALLLFACCLNMANAQKPVAVAEQYVFFPYATGERTDKKLKVMIIGTHILRYSNLSTLPSGVITGLRLDFRKLLDPIERNERHFPADYDNIQYDKQEVEDLNGSYLSWNSSVIRNNDLSSSDNTLSALEKIRTRLIDRYRAEGYRVYQVNFTPDAASTSYQYYDATTLAYKPLSYEKIAPLSPLYVRVYEKGEIKGLLAQLGGGSTSSGFSGLTIESKDDKKDNKNTGQKSSGGTRKMTDEEIRINISYHKTIAESMVAEGDKLYAAGESNYREALAKYEAAQREYYSTDVQLKIDHIKKATWVGMADAGTELAKSLQNIAEATDPHEKTKAGFFLFNYAGLSGSYSELMNPSLQKPMDAYVSVIMHRIFLSWEIRVGYMESPLYEYTIDKGNSPTTHKVQLQTTCITAGSSVGLNIPLKPLVLNAMYGIDLADGISTGRKLMNTDFTLKDMGMVPLWRTKTSFGATLNIPKTKLSIGVQYHLYQINGKDYTNSNTGYEIIYNKDQSNKYYYGKTTNDKYKFSNLGISFGWIL